MSRRKPTNHQHYPPLQHTIKKRFTALPPAQSPPLAPFPASTLPLDPPVADDGVRFRSFVSNASPGGMTVVPLNNLVHDSPVFCVRYTRDGQFLFKSSTAAARVFDATTGRFVAELIHPSYTQAVGGTRSDNYVRAVCFSPDSNWLLTGAEDHVVNIWDWRNRRVKHRLVGHDAAIYCVETSANNQFIVSGSAANTTKVWSLQTGSLLTTLAGVPDPTGGITSVAVLPSNRHVATASLDSFVRVWDVEAARLVRQFEVHRGSTYSVAFSPDGRMLLSGSLDGTLKLWDLRASGLSNQSVLSLRGHSNIVLSVAFSPNGKWLLSGSKDRTARIWDSRQAGMCLTFVGHKNSVLSIAHSPASETIATGARNGCARTWRYDGRIPLSR